MKTIESLFGCSVTSKTKKDCVALIMRWIKSGEKQKFLACANPYSLELARKKHSFKEALKNADLVIPDGAGVVMASKMLGGDIPARLTGTDIFLSLSAALDKEGGGTYFFLGSTEPVLTAIRQKMAADFPKIKVVGSLSPPFKQKLDEKDNQTIIEAINKAKPDVLWVGMTAPKQEEWLYENRTFLEVKFMGAIGAAFDFYSGNVKRAPLFIQEMGLEWLYRTLCNPIKILPRYPNTLCFVARALWQAAKRGR